VAGEVTITSRPESTTELTSFSHVLSEHAVCFVVSATLWLANILTSLRDCFPQSTSNIRHQHRMRRTPARPVPTKFAGSETGAPRVCDLTNAQPLESTRKRVHSLEFAGMKRRALWMFEVLGLTALLLIVQETGCGRMQAS